MIDRQDEPLTNGDAHPEETESSRIDRKKRERRREIRGWVISLVAAIVIALLLRFFVFEFIRVEGPSMEPTLSTNEYVFMEKMTYRFAEPDRGDIVICKFPGRKETFVKRVIGIEGDVLEIRSGVLYVNGAASYDYYDGVMNVALGELIVPESTVFVMGDNRNHSMDSTSSSIGALGYDMILGKASFILWPPGKIDGL